MNMDITALKAAAYDRINQTQRLQAELQQLNQLIYQAENPQAPDPAGSLRQPSANDDAAKVESGAEKAADSPEHETKEEDAKSD